MIFVTGATGFLGRHLIPSLLAAGYQVRALVRPSSDTLFLQQLGVELAYAADISDATAVSRACQGCSQVIHAAGQFRFWGSTLDFWQTNVAGTAAVLEAAAATGVSRVIHISSFAVVGTPPSSGQIDAQTPCKPQEPYQQSKLEAEQLALAYHRARGLPVIVLRPGAFYGPGGRYGFNRLFFEEPLRGWRIQVDNGRYIMFPVFVPDVVQAILLSLKHGQLGATYHIGSQPLAHREINGIVNELAGMGHLRLNVPASAVLLLARGLTAVSRYTKKEPFYPVNMAPYVFQDWRVSIQSTINELGFKPTPLVDGVRATLEWYWREGVI